MPRSRRPARAGWTATWRMSASVSSRYSASPARASPARAPRPCPPSRLAVGRPSRTSRRLSTCRASDIPRPVRGAVVDDDHPPARPGSPVRAARAASAASTSASSRAGTSTQTSGHGVGVRAASSSSRGRRSHGRAGCARTPSHARQGGRADDRQRDRHLRLHRRAEASSGVREPVSSRLAAAVDPRADVLRRLLELRRADLLRRLLELLRSVPASAYRRA